MGVEIERKFLVDHALWHDVDKGMGTHYRQGYLLSDGRHTIRVRVSDTEGYLNMKSEVSSMVRKEYDYPIPLTDALEILDLFTKNGTEKMRYCIPFAGKIWEVDVFLGDNAGLIVAELELEDENEKFEIPAWVNTEVTSDARYTNSALSLMPYCRW